MLTQTHVARSRHRRLSMLSAALALALCLQPAKAADVAGSVESGLAELAQAIAQKSRAAERTTIAVLPFPHADGSCSVLSTYIVDELILSLFSIPNSQLDIIERAQLEALIREMKIGEGGLLNPTTTKQLGHVSGVSALIIGTITVIGDSVRLNARLVATDTGKTISAAAVTIPKTQAVGDLLGQITPCSTLGGESHQTADTSPPSASPQDAAEPQVSSDRTAQMIVHGIKGTIMSASRSSDGKHVTIALQVENTTKKDLWIALVGPAPSAIDSEGGTYAFKSFAGAAQCPHLEADQVLYCLGGYSTFPSAAFTTLSTGSKTTVVFSFEGQPSKGSLISFSSTFALHEIQTPDGSTPERKPEIQASTIGFGVPAIRLGKSGG